MSSRGTLYGLLAEFDTPDALVEAARRVREAGYRKVDAYSPFPIEEVFEALHFHEKKLPILVFLGGLVGCAIGFGMQYYAAVVSYPVNVGGRPLNSWPAFVPVAFELTILIAALCAVFGMLLLNGLPMPYHPLFNNKKFSLATSHGFFIAIESSDPLFDRAGTEEFLSGLRAKGVTEIEA